MVAARESSAASPAEKTCSDHLVELKYLAINHSDDPQSTSFFPRESLQRYFTTKVVDEILACRCNSCRNDVKLELFGPVIRTEISRNIPEAIGDYVSIFALLLYIGHPQLIPYFTSHEHKDNRLEVWVDYAPKDFLDTIWPGYRSKDEKRADYAARQFLSRSSRFCVPTLSTPAYVKWSKGRLLPFINERVIACNSGSSRVVAFEIYGSYKQFPGLNATKFARKEITTGENDQDEIQAAHEKTALQLVRELRHDHIVHMIKTYSLGNTFNIMFPRAKTNLQDYLRNRERFKAHEARDRNIWSDAFWTQMIGITDALFKVHKLGEHLQKQASSTEKSSHIAVGKKTVQHFLIGCHFDLKPENILVEEDDSWKITDFGQTVLKAVNKSGVSSNLPHVGGTPSYSPPLDENEQPNRRYDVWSLACIMLEVTAFLVLNYEGPKELEKARTTFQPEKHVSEYHSFYARDPNDTKRYVLKPAVARFMDELPDKHRVEDAKGRKFLVEVLQLVRLMFNPDSNARLHAEDVHQRLKRTREEFQLTAESGLPPSWASKEPSSEENAKLREIARNGMYYEWDEVWEDVWLEVQPTAKRVALGIEKWSNPDKQRSTYLPQQASLTPLYRFRSSRDAGARICLSDEDHNLNIKFTKESDALIFQSLMTGHEIAKDQRFGLEHFSFTPLSRPSVKLRNLANKGKAKAMSLPFFQKQTNAGPSSSSTSQSEDRSSSTSTESPEHNSGDMASVQLWIEQKCWFSGVSLPSIMATFDCLNLTALKNKYATFGNPGGYVERAVRPRRVVIYGIGEHGKSMATLRFHQNFKLLDDEASQTVQFIPTNKARDKRFSMTIFKPPPDRDGQECFAGIPMHSEVLKKYEDEHSIDCKEVTLKFKNNEEREQFANEYLWMRHDWSNERHPERGAT